MPISRIFWRIGNGFKKIIYDELLEIQAKFGDDRRTELQVGDLTSIEDEDLIEEEEIIVTLTHNGYVKRLPVDEFKSQNRGGRGVKGMGVHNDDFIEHLIASSTHDRLLFFTNSGKVFTMKGYEIPEYGRAAQGIPIINLLGINADEQISAVINVSRERRRMILIYSLLRNKERLSERQLVSLITFGVMD